MSEPLSINTSNFYALPTRLNSFTDKELLKSAANRMLHSKEYKILYLALAAVSFVCLIVSLLVSCPSSIFYFAEGIVLVFMIIEFSIRYVAIGKSYFNSLFNIADVGVIALCVIVFCLLMSRSCSEEASTEAVIEDVLLVARNVIQLTRLVMMLQKNQQQMRGTRRVELDQVAGISNGHLLQDAYKWNLASMKTRPMNFSKLK